MSCYSPSKEAMNCRNIIRFMTLIGEPQITHNPKKYRNLVLSYTLIITKYHLTWGCAFNYL